MRIRHKPYAYPELCSWPYFIKDPPALRGQWHTLFGNDAPIVLELGCGKGAFASQYAAAHPDRNLIAVDIKNEILVLAKRKLEAQIAAGHILPGQVYIMAQDIMRISLMLAPEDRIAAIYINFCNPWPKTPHKKRRLTHPKQLMQYRSFLNDGGEIRFKTDDDELFEESLEYFRQCGFDLAAASRDIHADGLPDGYLMTEHEEQFLEMGRTIKYAVARKQPDTVSPSRTADCR